MHWQKRTQQQCTPRKQNRNFNVLASNLLSSFCLSLFDPLFLVCLTQFCGNSIFQTFAMTFSVKIKIVSNANCAQQNQQFMRNECGRRNDASTGCRMFKILPFYILSALESSRNFPSKLHTHTHTTSDCWLLNIVCMLSDLFFVNTTPITMWC